MCLRESCTLLLVVLLFLLQYHCSDAFKIKVFRRKFGEHSTREHLLNTYPDRRRSSKIMYSILTMSMQGKMIESFGRRDSTEQKPPSGGIKSKGANNERKHKAQTISGSRKEVSVIDSKSSGIRVNKCLQTLSRRAADTAIEEGRVTINGRVCKPGDKVNIGDNIRLDGKVQVWEEFVQAQTSTFRVTNEEREHIYLKYWKPLGVVCTCDKREANNIISAGKFHLFPQRLFTVGRLDKDSTGLILVTSDGRVNNALLSKHFKKEKVIRDGNSCTWE